MRCAETIFQQKVSDFGKRRNRRGLESLCRSREAASEEGTEEAEERVDFLTHTIKDLMNYNLVCVVSMYSEKSH